MFLRPRVLRALPAALLSVSLAFCASASAKVVKTPDYRPFTVISSKLGKEMPDSHIQDRLMCRSPMSALADNLDLLQNYDLLGSSHTDGTMSETSFRGRQDGKIVQVMFWVETSSRQLNPLWVDGKPVFNCWWCRVRVNSTLSRGMGPVFRRESARGRIYLGELDIFSY